MTANLRWLPALLLLACAHPSARPSAARVSAAGSDDLDVLQRQIDSLGQAYASLALNYSKLAANFAFHACNQDLKMILSKLRAECEARLAAASKPVRLASTAPLAGKGANKRGLPPADPLTACPSAYVRPRLLDFEESLGVSVAKLLTEIPHEVIYFAGDKGSIGSDRERRLQELVAVPFLAASRLLLITASDRADDDANRRLEWTIKRLIDAGVPANKIDRPLKYQLNISADDLRPHERPELLEPKELSRAVWIFLLSC